MPRPNIVRRHRVSIVCEGAEEELYIKSLIGQGLWERYVFKVVNAKGSGNVAARYQHEVQEDSSEAVLIFCDTDRRPHKEYTLIKEKLHDILGNKADLGRFLIFANPCSMQIILLHFGEEPVSLVTQSKRVNEEIIEELTGVPGYRANQKTQITAICNKINRENYGLMKSRAALLPKADDEPGGSNFHHFVGCFEQENTEWIASIRKLFD